MVIEFMVKGSDGGASPLVRMKGTFERYPAIGDTIWFDRLYIVKDVIYRELCSIVYILEPKEHGWTMYGRKE